MAAVRHLGFVGRDSDHPRWPLSGPYCCAKFGWNRWSSFNNTKLSIFCKFGWKTPIHTPQNWSFWGYLTPKNAQQYQQPPPQKKHILRESASFESSSVKIRRRVWLVGEFPKKGINNFFKILSFHPFSAVAEGVPVCKKCVQSFSSLSWTRPSGITEKRG